MTDKPVYYTDGTMSREIEEVKDTDITGALVEAIEALEIGYYYIVDRSASEQEDKDADKLYQTRKKLKAVMDRVPEEVDVVNCSVDDLEWALKSYDLACSTLLQKITKKGE